MDKAEAAFHSEVSNRAPDWSISWLELRLRTLHPDSNREAPFSSRATVLKA